MVGSASGTAYFDDVSVTPIEPTVRSAVTIMFDDGESSVYSLAKPFMDVHGFKGSASIPVGDLGQPGVMTSAEVQALQASGWEIVSHAMNNDTNLVALSPAQAAEQIANSKTLLEALGLTIKSISWPFGAYNAALIGNAQSSGYTSARTFEVGDNPQGAFPYDIKVRQVKNTTTVADIASWIAEGQSSNKWEVIVFHTIANTGDDAYYTPSITFGQMMNAVAQSGVSVLTYEQGLQAFGVK